MAEAQTDKQEWRRRLKSARAALPAAARRAAGDRIRERVLELDQAHQPRAVFCFVSSGDEVDTRALIDRLLARGRRLFIPRITGVRDMLAVEFPGWAALEPGVLGIPAPRSETGHAGAIDMVITPGLGFTAGGCRLGMGRGYYDRWFASHAYGLSVAVCFECQIVADLPATATDMPVDLIVTEDRVLNTRAGH
jgi:5-formyltetrahydrofolate cyclo-ligase